MVVRRCKWVVCLQISDHNDLFNDDADEAALVQASKAELDPQAPLLDGTGDVEAGALLLQLVYMLS